MNSTYSALMVSPREPGFEQYTRDLVDAARKLALPGQTILDPLYFDPLDSSSSAKRLADLIAKRKPTLVHIQHEFGFMGSKTPGRYRSPALIRRLRQIAPDARLVATAHTVLSKDYAYPWRGRGLQAPFRFAANQLLLPFLRRLWIQGSWGRLDGVIAHSSLQVATLNSSGCPIADSIPHYVPEEEHGAGTLPGALRPIPPDTPVLLIFGYFTPEKAQDVAIRAMAHLKSPAHLVLGGGIRRQEDQGYFESCRRLVQELGLEDRVQITGFVSFEELDALVRLSRLVILPFRETSGSGSLADLMSRRAPILASDLPLNREIAERTPGAMRFFRSEDPEDCARQIDGLLARPDELALLRQGAERYAEAHSASRMARRHLDFYERVLNAR